MALDNPTRGGTIISHTGDQPGDRTREHAELASHAQLQQLVNSLATGFINLPLDQLDDAVVFALGEISAFLRADRAAMFLIDDDGDSIRYTHEWCRDPSFAVSADTPKRRLTDLPRAAASLHKGDILNVPSIEALGDSGGEEMRVARELGIRSHVQVPLISSGQLVGGLVFVAITEERHWHVDETSVLRVAAEMLSNVIERRCADAERSRHAELLHLIAELAAEFVNLPVEDIDEGIVRALARLGTFLGSDRASIVRFDGNAGERPQVYHWSGDGSVGNKEILESTPISSYPWLIDRLVTQGGGEICDVKKLPEAAAKDRVFLSGFGIRSVIDTALISGSVHMGSLAFVSAKPSRPRPPEFFDVLKVAAEMFSNALARKELYLEHERLARRNQLILDAAGEGVYGLDPDGRATFVNQAAARMLGWSAEELIGKRQHEILHHTRADGRPYPADQCPIYAAYRDRTTHSRDDEVFWRKDGSNFPVEYVSSPLIEGDTATGAVVVFRDVSEFRARDAERRRHADLERVITMFATDFINRPIEELDDAIVKALDELRSTCGADRTAVLMLTNDHSELRLAYESTADGQAPSAEILGGLPRARQEWTVVATAARSAVGVESPDDLPPDAHYEREIMRGLDVYSFISVPMVTGRSVLGTVMFATCRSDLRWSDETRTLLTIASEMFASALERRCGEEEARRHRNALAHALRVGTMGELAAGLAHELNQPLAAISNYALGSCRRLENGAVDTPELSKTLEEIAALALRAGAVVRGMRSQISGQGASRERHDIATLVAEAASLASAEARSSGVSIDTRLVADAIAQVDAIQIQQVILNLIRNAIESIEASGAESRTVVISADRHDDHTIEIAVSDSGHGIDDADPSRLFDQFYTTKPRGLGLGLSISRSIVSAHGGTLRARANPDRGATFSFTLPAVCAR